MLRNIKYKREQGNVIGGWKLIEVLGSGQNGDVWEVSKSGHGNSAMKILKLPNEACFKKFIAEIHVLSKAKIAGVIQIIESNIPTDFKKDLPWFVMPKAIEICEALKKKSILEVAAQFVLLAETLAKLHDLEIIHGDIKLGNILSYQERLCFCDFGAAKYTNKKENTTETKHEIAMYKMPKAEYAKRCDVYCLARTLWMMITKQKKRLDGQYNPNYEVAIKLYCQGLNTTALDNLLIESTDRDKRIRPSARQFSVRLNEWIKLNEVLSGSEQS